MKQKIFLVVVSSIIFYACDFSGQKTNPSTGLSVKARGFSYEKAFLVGPDNTPRSTNQVELGSNVSIVIEGIKDYEAKGGMAFPGLMITVTDKDGIAVINEADLLPDENGYPLAKATALSGTVKVGAPMKRAESYHVKMIVWDKNKPENELTAEMDLIVQ